MLLDTQVSVLVTKPQPTMQKVAAEAKFKKELAEQIKGLTGLETKYVPQSDGRIAIYLSS